MKKIMAAFIVLPILVMSVVAQPFASVSPVKIQGLMVLGKGVAANPNDPMDFRIAKIGIGKVKVPVFEEVFTVGVLKLDEEKYKLKEITVDEGRVTGKIYANGSEVGSFDLSSVMKGDTEVWAGTITINGKVYNTYIIEGVRPVRPGELKEKVADYCKKHPKDKNCREIISEKFCENNPEDRRCRAIFIAQCMKEDKNLEDMRCREALKEFCKENPTDKRCVPFELRRAKHYCEEHSDSPLCRKIGERVLDFCKENPENEGCTVVKKIIQERPRLFEKIQEIRKRITELRTKATKIQEKIEEEGIGEGNVTEAVTESAEEIVEIGKGVGKLGTEMVGVGGGE